mgnify:CR=1 FL=1
MEHTNFEIVRAQAEDAAALLDYLKIVGGETDNLSFGAEGVPLDVEAEKAYLGVQAQSQDNIQLLAKANGLRRCVRPYGTHTCFCKGKRSGTGQS